jgi:hypothetical protein
MVWPINGQVKETRVGHGWLETLRTQFWTSLLSSKRILHLQARKVAAVAQHNFRFEWQLEKQCSTEICSSRPWFTNDKGASRAHINDMIVT